VYQLILTKAILKEYRRVLNYAHISRFGTPVWLESMEDTLDKLRYLADFPEMTGVRFRYDRDPTDEKIIEAAIGGNASHLMTRDKDLLTHGHEHTEPAKRLRQRLPKTKVLRPEQLLAERNN
jgi:putative PIN family toxin of toxin-antitoxin system